jgi:two-component system NtrC family sensor kinase
MGREEFRRTATTLAWIGVAWIMGGVLLWLAVAWQINRYILRPVAALTAGIRRIAAGDWSRPVDLPQQDELGDLARQFNELTDTLTRRAGQHAHLATAGELLAGVAHELNNPLQAIHGIAELRAGAEGRPGDWQDVLDATRRASKLAQELVLFVRPAARQVGPVSLNDVVERALALIGFQYRADGVAIDLELDGGLPLVQADAHELVQVLVNLLGNAHGVLQRGAGAKRVSLRTWAEDGRVCARVRDTGPGVPPDVRAHIFSPFFSTREDGVGLGLTVGRNMIRAAGGELQLDAADGGASFTLWLPAAGAASAVPAAARAPRAATSLASATILLADDEGAIRAVLERFFRREGARVLTASGGREALELLRKEPVDAVLLDVRMPDLDGALVYQALRAENPEVARRTLFLSGDGAGVAAELSVPARRVLAKPVELEELRRVVVDLLDGAPS